jgi:hypothetical protein
MATPSKARPPRAPLRLTAMPHDSVHDSVHEIDQHSKMCAKKTYEQYRWMEPPDGIEPSTCSLRV